MGFIPFPRVLVLCEMQSVLSRIWTRVAVSISYVDNHYTTGTPINLVYCSLFSISLNSKVPASLVSVVQFWWVLMPFCRFWYSIVFICQFLKFIIIIVNPLRVFHTSVSWWSFTRVWLTASLLKSSGVSSGFFFFYFSDNVYVLISLFSFFFTWCLQ